MLDGFRRVFSPLRLSKCSFKIHFLRHELTQRSIEHVWRQEFHFAQCAIATDFEKDLSLRLLERFPAQNCSNWAEFADSYGHLEVEDAIMRCVQEQGRALRRYSI